MRQIREYAVMAMRSILSNKTRSLLTMLGIIIGIGSVIMVLSVGGGGQKMMNSELGSLANGSVYLSVSGENTAAGDYFTDADLEALRSAPGVAGATMALNTSGSVQGARESLGAGIQAGNGDMAVVFPPKMKAGRFWDKADADAARRVVTIDEKGAKALFGTANVVGMSVQLTVGGRTSDFVIVGITESGGGYSFNGQTTAQMTAPVTSLAAMTDGLSAPYYQIALIAADKTQSAALAKQLIPVTDPRHGNAGRNCYGIIDVSQYTSQINKVTSTFTGIIAAIAGISLLVGGIGVMNIMLVSVTERTREIGIRKALGAKTGSITFQFLVEAGTLTLLGGLIGILIGVLGGSAISKAMGLEGYVSPATILAIALFSVGIGIFFGIYPARKAAKLSPIEALRTE